MPAKTVVQKCILAVIADGFDEADTIRLISILRRAGQCVKSMGMTGNLVTGAYGICLAPDMTFSDLDCLDETASISAVVLPENKQSLNRLEADPRLHKFLRQVLAQGGQIVMGSKGRQFLKKISVGAPGMEEGNNGVEPLLLLREQGQSIEALARDLLHRIGQPSRL